MPEIVKQFIKIVCYPNRNAPIAGNKREKGRTLKKDPFFFMGVRCLSNGHKIFLFNQVSAMIL